jgi:hypothetical protein
MPLINSESETEKEQCVVGGMKTKAVCVCLVGTFPARTTLQTKAHLFLVDAGFAGSASAWLSQYQQMEILGNGATITKKNILRTDTNFF